MNGGPLKSIGSAAGGFASAAGGLLSGAANAIIGQAFAKKNAQTAHQYELANLAKQNEYAVKMFQMQNQRQDWLLQNQKSMEVQGLRNAGLNPALAGGGVQPVTAPLGSTGSAATSAAPSGPTSPFGNVDTSMFNPVNVELAKSSTELNRANAIASLTEAMTSKKKLDPVLKNIASQTAKNIAESNYISGAKTANTEASTQQISATIDNLKAQTQSINDMRPYQIDKLVAEKNKLNADAYVAYKKLPYEIKELCARVTELNSQANLNNKSAAYVQKEIDNYDQVVANLREQWHLTHNQAIHEYEAYWNAVLNNELTDYQLGLTRKYGESQAKLMVEQMSAGVENTKANTQKAVQEGNAAEKNAETNADRLTFGMGAYHAGNL